jgi:cell division protein FtsL
MVINDYTQKTYKQTAKTKKRFALNGKKLIAALILLLVVLAGSQLALSNYLSTKGQRVWEIDQKAKSLEEESSSLRMEIAQNSSLKSIAQKALAVGLSRTNNFVYLKDRSPLAFRK